MDKRIKQFRTLLRREFWEHRNTFIILPGVVGGFMILLMVGLFITSGFTSINAQLSVAGDNESKEWRIESDQQSMDQTIGFMLSNLRTMSEAEREHNLSTVFNALGAPFMIVLIVVVLFYLLGSLYEDRKDRSILFWKSMPVSDVATVSMKLFTALVAVPGVYLACVAIVQVMLLLMASLAALGHDVEIFNMLWVPSNLIGRWFTDISYVLVQAIWSLPLYGWMLLVSAFAKSVPLVWFLGVPIAISIIEGLVFGGDTIRSWMFDHASPTPHPSGLQLADMTSYVASLDTFIGLLLGAVFIGGAIWLRGKGDEL
jgi:ABC-2 type transport system permease protein